MNTGQFLASCQQACTYTVSSKCTMTSDVEIIVKEQNSHGRKMQLGISTDICTRHSEGRHHADPLYWQPWQSIETSMLGLITHKWITVLHNHSLINGDGCGANIDVTSHKINAKINILKKNILTAFFAPNYFPTLFLTTSFLDRFPQLIQLSAHANGGLSPLFVFESRNPLLPTSVIGKHYFSVTFFTFWYALCHKTLTTLVLDWSFQRCLERCLLPE